MSDFKFKSKIIKPDDSYSLLMEVREACLFSGDTGIEITTEPHISEELFDRICSVLNSVAEPAKEVQPAKAESVEKCQCGHTRDEHDVGDDSDCNACYCTKYFPEPQAARDQAAAYYAQAIDHERQEAKGDSIGDWMRRAKAAEMALLIVAETANAAEYERGLEDAARILEKPNFVPASTWLAREIRALKSRTS